MKKSQWAINININFEYYLMKPIIKVKGNIQDLKKFKKIFNLNNLIFINNKYKSTN